ncbi:protein Nazo-like [Drosophila kikkawai]|uniref:Protein Nazo-like n=1 Tax=Drosophila kikkawai TaxID=30033 RepID=A0A6P4J7B1_DROKI|nr:protein C19orf12 homolog [Drosophila kikkawai]
MSVSTQELIKALSILVDNENVQVTFQESAKGAAVCVLSALLGGLLLGPRGVALGGGIGAIAAYGLTEGKFKPLSEIIASDLSKSEREALRDHVVNAIFNIRRIDAVQVVGLILSIEDIRNFALNKVRSFVTERMGLTIVD